MLLRATNLCLFLLENKKFNHSEKGKTKKKSCISNILYTVTLRKVECITTILQMFKLDRVKKLLKRQVSKERSMSPYAVESFSLPGPGNVKCEYEEVIDHEQK